MTKFGQWLLEFYITRCRQPNLELFDVLRGEEKYQDLTVSVVNHARTVAKAIGGGRTLIAATSTLPAISHDKAILDLYYKLLHGIIETLMKRDDSDLGLYDTSSAKYTQKLNNARFHKALLCCAAEVIACAFQGREFPAILQSMDMIKASVDVWIVAAYILEGQAILNLPSELIEFLESAQETILMRSCFSHGSTIYLYLLEGGGGLHLTGEMQMVSKILLQFAYLILEMTTIIVESYSQEKRLSQVETEQFADFCRDLVDRVLFNHLYLFFRRSVLVPILCCIFSICKLRKIEIRFQELLSHSLRQFPELELPNLRNIFIARVPHEVQNGSFGSICSFFNQTFLAACQEDIEASKQRMEEILHENEASFDTSF